MFSNRRTLLERKQNKRRHYSIKHFKQTFLQYNYCKKDQELAYIFLLDNYLIKKSLLNILLLHKIINCFLFSTPQKMDMYFFLVFS